MTEKVSLNLTSQTPSQNKSYALPGYTGHVPSMNSGNRIARSYTKLSRRCFDKTVLDEQPYGLSTTG